MYHIIANTTRRWRVTALTLAAPGPSQRSPRPPPPRYARGCGARSACGRAAAARRASR